MARKSCKILALLIILLIPITHGSAQVNVTVGQSIEVANKKADSNIRLAGTTRIAKAATCPATPNHLNSSKRNLSEIAFHRIPGITPNLAARQLSSQQKPLGFTYGPFWQVGGGYASTLIVKNRDRENPVIATVVLFSPDGKEEQKTLLEVPANSAGRLRLADIVKTEGDAIHSGGLKLLFNEPNPKTISQVAIENYKTGVIFDLEVFGGYRYDTENALHASWWLPDEGTDGIITLFNSSTERISVSPSVVVDALEHAADSVSLAPNEMKRLHLRDLLQKHDFKVQGSGSVILHYTGPAHALYPSLLLSNPKTGFSLVPTFNAKHDQQANKKTQWQFPAVFLSSNPALGFNQNEKLTAYTLLTNGTKNLIATDFLAHVSGSAENVQDITLPVKPLAPLETRLINLSEELSNLGIFPDVSHISLGVGHNGNPGDLGITVFSVGQSKDFVFRSEGAVHPARTVDSSYWDIGGDLVSVLAVYNSSAKSTTARATLSYETQNGPGTYLLPLINLPAKGSQVLNLKEAVLAGTPDENGSVIPSGITFGTLLLEVTDKSSQDFILGGTTTFDPVKGGYGIFIDPGCGDFCSTCEDCQDFGSGFECVPSCDNAACCPPPLPQPQITGISPNQVPIGTTSVQITLKGTFNANPRIIVSGSTITAGSASFDQSGNLIATFTISSSAVVGGYFVTEEDDGGQSSTRVTFSIAPRVDNISPAVGLVGTAIPVTISGAGFTGTTLNAGQNITISNIQVNQQGTQITATFTSTNSTSAGGNQSVTVTANQTTSASQNFFVQIPTHSLRLDFPGAPGGIGPIMRITDATVVDLAGVPIASLPPHQCGVYENFIFQLADQQIPPVPIMNGTVTITEVFSNIMNPPGPTPAVITINLATTGLGDTQAWTRTAPSCPPTNDNQTLDMTWTVTIGSKTYPLATMLHITKGNFNGTLNVTSQITTP